MKLRATYTDSSGSEDVTIFNDGEVLRMTVRGVLFAGSSFEDFAPVHGPPPAELGFTLHDGDLCSCVVECEFPLPVTVEGEDQAALLCSRLKFADPTPAGGLTDEVLTLELKLGGTSYRSGGTSGWYEDELLDIQRALPEGSYLKACITCAFSDYSPYGHGLFGSLVCFREAKEAYRAVNSKAALLEIWSECSGDVQETFLCAEYERRRPGAGYRG